VQSVANLL